MIKFTALITAGLALWVYLRPCGATISALVIWIITMGGGCWLDYLVNQKDEKDIRK
jgi:hypothetical protein